jgi:hypothetical protein
LFVVHNATGDRHTGSGHTSDEPSSLVDLPAAINRQAEAKPPLLVVSRSDQPGLKVVLEPAMSAAGIYAARIDADGVGDGEPLLAAGWELDDLDKSGVFYRRRFPGGRGSGAVVAEAITDLYGKLGLPADAGAWSVWPVTELPPSRVTDEPASASDSEAPAVSGETPVNATTARTAPVSGTRAAISAIATVLGLLYFLDALVSLPGDLLAVGRDFVKLIHEPGTRPVPLLGSLALFGIGFWILLPVLREISSGAPADNVSHPLLYTVLGVAAVTAGVLSFFTALS